MQGLQSVLKSSSLLSSNVKLFIYLMDHYSLQVHDYIETYVDKLDSQLIAQIYRILFDAFTQENLTGPSYHHHDIDARLAEEEQLRKQTIPEMEFEISEFDIQVAQICSPTALSRVMLNHLYESNANEEFILEQLQVQGEAFKRVIKLKHVFLTCKTLLRKLNKNGEFIIEWARINFMHNELLDNPVTELKDICLQAYELVPNKDAIYHVEFAYVLNYYYKYNLAEQHLENASAILHVKFDLTGMMGYRTKYQQDKVAQLVAFAQTDDQIVQQEIKELPNIFEVIQQAPVAVDLDEESILYEKPQIDKEDQVLKTAKSELTLQEQVLLLGYINHYKKTLPNDEILKQQIGAYVQLMLDRSRSWIVYSQGLLQRSLNEYVHFKKMERALAQMQILVDQFNERQPSFEQRQELFFAVHYPDFYSLSGLLGEHWMKVGAVSSGYQIFTALEMWDECVECIVQMGDIQRAQTEIEKLVEMGKGTLKMKCIYAEIKQDKALLKEVWLKSNKRFARAQRSLGEMAFFKDKNYPKAIKHLQKAVQINSYNARCWFLIGCAQMRTGLVPEAVKSFGQCVSVNEKDAEAWGNMSGCLIQLKKYQEAMSALEQGVKHADSDWKLWSNLMAISLRNKKFYRFYTCIERLFLLNQHALIDEQICMKINQTFHYHIGNKETPIRQVKLYKDRINRLYELIVKEIGQKYYVWEQLAVFTELLYAYQDRVSLEEPIEKMDYVNDITEFRMKSCQMLMTVGWDRDIQICELLLIQSCKVRECSVNVTMQDTQKNVKMFLETMKSKLEAILERKVDL